MPEVEGWIVFNSTFAGEVDEAFDSGMANEQSRNRRGENGPDDPASPSNPSRSTLIPGKKQKSNHADQIHRQRHLASDAALVEGAENLRSGWNNDDGVEKKTALPEHEGLQNDEATKNLASWPQTSSKIGLLE